MHRVRRRRADAARVSRRASGAVARRRRAGLGPRRERAGRRGGRARDHRADALDAGVLLGRRRRLAAAGVVLLDVPGGVASRRLDRDHLARDGDHLRPLGLDDQPRRRTDGDQRDLPRGAGGAARWSTRWWSTCRGPAPTAGCRCSWSCARARSSTTSWSATIRRRVREDCSPRHVPNEIRQIDEVPRTLSGKVLEVPVKRILTGTPVDQAASPGVAGQPRGAGLLRRAGGREAYVAPGRRVASGYAPTG